MPSATRVQIFDAAAPCVAFVDCSRKSGPPFELGLAP